MVEAAAIPDAGKEIRHMRVGMGPCHHGKIFLFFILRCQALKTAAFSELRGVSLSNASLTKISPEVKWENVILCQFQMKTRTPSVSKNHCNYNSYTSTSGTVTKMQAKAQHHELFSFVWVVNVHDKVVPVFSYE